MVIRSAEQNDIPVLLKLLKQVCNVHHVGRPDLFQKDGSKYTHSQLSALLHQQEKPVFVAQEDEAVLGYAFCVLQNTQNSTALMPVKTLYIDDLCVDENARGKQIGKLLYEHVCAFAKQTGCYNITLNVWASNESALRFYEKCGLKPQKYGLEHLL